MPYLSHLFRGWPFMLCLLVRNWFTRNSVKVFVFNVVCQEDVVDAEVFEGCG
jgi:hypothetical protein